MNAQVIHKALTKLTLYTINHDEISYPRVINKIMNEAIYSILNDYVVIISNLRALQQRLAYVAEYDEDIAPDCNVINSYIDGLINGDYDD